MLFVSSCKKEAFEIYDLKVKPEEITSIELRADHKTLIPNGVCKMEFHPRVYAKRTVKSYVKEGSEFLVKEESVEFLVPDDQLPHGVVKIYDASGKELQENVFSTSTGIPNTQLQFYAQAGNIKSNTLTITLREIPNENYQEIVIPVIFHLLQPPATSSPEYNFTQQFLEEQLERASAIFNRQITTDPNGGNAKIRFRLAEYNPAGSKLVQPGLNIVNISVADFTAMGTSSTKRTQYEAYILANKKNIIWDPNRYLNIWLTKFSTSYTASGSNTAHTYLPPRLIHPSFAGKTIPGLTLTSKNSISVDEVTDIKQVGIMVNIRGLTMPSSVQGTGNEYTLAYSLGLYLGLLETNSTNTTTLINGDNDYCPDTYTYYYAKNASVYKSNMHNDKPATPVEEYFTSYNVMDMYSRKNSISADQAKRVRDVLEKCPDRWAYKSSWAFTGKTN